MLFPTLLSSQRLARQSKSTEDVQSTYLIGRTAADTLSGDAIEYNGSVVVEMYPTGTPEHCGTWCLTKSVLSVVLNLCGSSSQYLIGRGTYDIEVRGLFQISDDSWHSWTTIGDTVKFRLHSDGSGSMTSQQEIQRDVSEYSPHVCGNADDTFQYIRFLVTYVELNGAPSSITDSLNLIAKMTEEARYHPSADTTTGCNTNIYTAAAGTYTNPVTLNWTRSGSCTDTYPMYEVEVLRLLNEDEELRLDHDQVSATVDWKTAQWFIIYGEASSIRFTLAEGTGFYVWRVRPIGNWYPGGIANELNWGCWTPAPSQGATITLTDTSATSNVTTWRSANTSMQYALFHYTQFDADKNWQFSRMFMEDTDGKAGIAEGMTYATSLLQPVQVQTPVATSGQVLVKQTVYDYAGRPMLVTLPATRAGITDGKLGYDTTIALVGSAKYRDKHFDESNLLRSPTTMDGRIKDYWGDASDKMLPTSDGYPFVRTLQSPDPLGRVIEQGAAGSVLRTGAHSVRTSYGSVSERELLSMFGNEAPKRDQVYKVATTDQNGVTSVSYMRYDDKVLATCIVGTDPSPNLLALNDSSNVNNLLIADTLKGGVNIGKRSLYAATMINLLDTVAVEFLYDHDQAQFEASCANLCRSCDYDVYLSVTDVKGDSLVYADTLRIDSATCASASTFDLGPVEKTLLPGQYSMKRVLVPVRDTSILAIYQENVIKSQKTTTSGLLKRIFTTAGFESDLAAVYTATQDSLENVAFRMMMRYKAFRDSIRQADDTLVIYQDSCCSVVLDTTYCKTGCETSEAERPRYAQMLINRWKDTLEVYGYDGDSIANYIYYYDGVPLFDGIAAPFADGVGLIDSLMRRMIDVGGYDCRKVYECWKATVEGYWTVAWEKTSATTARPRYGVNILDYFLECTGSMYCSVADFVDKTTGDAWLLNAWSTLPKTNPTTIFDDCADRFEYSDTSALWTCDGTNNAEVNNRYRELRSCISGQIAMALDNGAGRRAYEAAAASSTQNEHLKNIDSTFTKVEVEEFLDSLKSECLTLCEERRNRFRDSLVAFYHEEGYFVEGYIGHDTTGGPLDTIRSYELSCRVASLVNFCESQCDFPIQWGLTSGSQDTLIRPNETDYANLAAAMYSTSWDIQFPMEGDTCASDEWARIGNIVILADVVVEELNRQLDRYRSDEATAVVSRWDIEPILDSLRSVWPQISSCLPPVDTLSNPADTAGMTTHPSSPFTVLVDKSRSSSFILVSSGGTCQIMYQPPVTMEVNNPYNRGNPHPIVGLLNGYIKDSWGKKIPNYALAAFDTTYGSTSFYNSMDYYEWYNLQPAGLGRWADANDPLKPDFACDTTDITTVFVDNWQLCPEPLACVNTRDMTLGKLSDFLTVVSSSRIAYRFNPSDDSLSIYGWLMFNVCGTTCSFRVNPPGSSDSLLQLYVSDSEVYGRKIDAARSEWSDWLTGQDFLDNIGEFIQTADGYLAFVNHLDSNEITVFDCIKFDCEPKPTDTCNYIPICNLCDTVSCGPFCFKWRQADTVLPMQKLPRVSCTVFEVQRLLREVESMLLGPCLDEKLLEVEISYNSSCFDPESVVDNFVARRGEKYYHYTLYYYDRAGNLVKTVPPAGFSPTIAAATRATTTSHTMTTKYEYNTLGQLTKQNTPDGGTTDFWYDNVGRVRLTHNARQASGTYTYTNYDELGRVIEVGEESGLGTTPQTYINANPATSRGTDITLTSWGVSFSIPSPWSTLTPRNLRNRISRTMTDVDGDTTTLGDQVITYYSYDPHGNVEWLVNKLPATDESLNPLVFCTAYDYDLISGKVKEVRLQPGRTDQFTQRYAYDHDQRITSVSTSRDGVMWEHEAAYAYFAHGPLKRMELGQDSVQGTDYAYTINGWLKGINMPSLSPDHDPGGDGAATGPNTGFARDAFGMILGYHEKDFVKSGSVYDSSHSTTSSWHVPNPTFLYNGNISSWSSNSRRASGATDTALASVYHYDLLNRIRSDSTRLRGATAWSAVGSHWQSAYTYDGNGNIQTLYRANASGSQMDNLTYEYISGTNKLVNVNDYQGASTGADIGDQDGNNYAYDATGNMTQDTAAGIEAGGIVWSPYNKIKSITKMGDDTTSKLVYYYDATGNRILKRYYKPHNTLKNTTWYARDAQGNTLATYTKPADSSTVRQGEAMVYGSTRLAVAHTQAPYSDNYLDTIPLMEYVSSRTLGEKAYELTDHLGNVRATVADLVIDHSGDLDAELVTRSDYYPFGMLMGGRQYSLDESHRYGFNGKENDNEVSSEAVVVAFEDRIYDVRTARWCKPDDLESRYTGLSPYLFGFGNPVVVVDADGSENVIVIGAQHDNSRANKLMFVHQAMRSAALFATDFYEPTTVIMFTPGYTQNQMEAVRSSLSGHGVNLVTVETYDQLASYINSKDVEQHEVTQARQADLVTNLQFYSHGCVGAIELGLNFPDASNMSLIQSNLNEIQSGAFAKDALVESFACRTGLGNSSVSLVRLPWESLKLDESLAQGMANEWDVSVSAFVTRTDYSGTLGSSSDRMNFKLGGLFGDASNTPLGKWRASTVVIDNADFNPLGAMNPVQGGDTPVGLGVPDTPLSFKPSDGVTSGGGNP